VVLPYQNTKNITNNAQVIPWRGSSQEKGNAKEEPSKERRKKGLGPDRELRRERRKLMRREY
jgi:hypothetical protein